MVNNAQRNRWCFRYGPNILLNSVEGYRRPSVWQCLEPAEKGAEPCALPPASLRDLDNSVVSGFQLATLAGPMCEEPLMGVCFSVERWDLRQTPAQAAAPDSEGAEAGTAIPGDGGAGPGPEVPAAPEEEEEAEAGPSQDTRRRAGQAGSAGCYGPVSGQLIAVMKEACRHAFQARPQRLMAAMYTCEIMATAEVLGERLRAPHTAPREGHIQPVPRSFIQRHLLKWPWMKGVVLVIG